MPRNTLLRGKKIELLPVSERGIGVGLGNPIGWKRH